MPCKTTSGILRGALKLPCHALRASLLLDAVKAAHRRDPLLSFIGAKLHGLLQAQNPLPSSPDAAKAATAEIFGRASPRLNCTACCRPEPLPCPLLPEAIEL